MIAQEITEFKTKVQNGGDGAQLPPVPKPTAPLPAPTKSPGMDMERDDQDHSGPMDIDEELRMKGQ